MTQAKTFNPNDPGTSDSNVFGLPYKATDADLVIIPVPWEATVSYGAGTIHGPEAILEASKQIDLYHPLIKEVWKHKMAIGDEEPSIRKLSKETRKFSKEIIETLAEGKEVSAKKNRAGKRSLRSYGAKCTGSGFAMDEKGEICSFSGRRSQYSVRAYAGISHQTSVWYFAD